ncbi:MAG TPA: MotA/TolQ/ExbB proton channel family protein [Chitinophagales bacterium]|nr:MotA/TolQ/ExbB proton channel family protein [Chitinophagales bacterium]
MTEQTLDNGKKEGTFQSLFATLVIPIVIVACILIYKYVLGNPSNFEGNDPANHPLPGNYLGIVYKGGFIVPILMALLILVITFSIERYITITKASGKGNADRFLLKIRSLLLSNSLEEASAECDRQKGSLGNVVKAGLKKYREMLQEKELTKDQKVLAIQKDIEEATELELPALERNLVIIATIASISTLFGLLGTVLGMIKAFAALATAGAPDSIQLANGISEALINTALGITASAIAIIMYNYFTTKIDRLTYSIDEAGFSIIQTYSSTQK